MPLPVREREAFRKRVQNFLVKNPNLKKSEVVKLFRYYGKEGIPSRTMYDVMDKLETDEPIKEKKRTGRPSSLTAAKASKLKRLTNNRTGVSQRRIARDFQADQSTICRMLSKMGIKYRKREKTPKYSEAQRVKATKLSRELLDEIRGSNDVIIVDDEKYFTFSGDNIPGNAGYYTNDKDKCPESVRFAGKKEIR